VRDAEGQKMSKSKGNVLDPIDLIDGIALDDLIAKRTSGLMQPQMADKIRKSTKKQFPDGIPAFGTDALRFTFASLASTGRDIRFDLNRIEGYRNFCNKLWNAARYVLMQTEGKDTGIEGDVDLSLADRWITSLLQQTEAEVRDHIEHYRFDLAAKSLYEFTWHEYCDWYLELSKPVLFDEHTPAAAQRGTRRTLVRVLEALLRLLHPIMPYITEEIWHQVAPLAGKHGDTIQLQPYPEADEGRIDQEALQDIEWVKTFILGMRRIRAEMDIAPGKPLPVLLQAWTEADQARFTANAPFINFLARPEGVEWLAADAEAPESATALVGKMKILIPLAGLVDKDAELARLDKEITKIQSNLEKTEAKLANPNFADKAPAEVVQKERDRQAEMRTALEQLEAQREKIRAL